MSESVESVSLTKTERVVVEQPVQHVIVTGIMAPRNTLALNSAYDVDLTNLGEGSLLVYSMESLKWQATKLLEKQIIEGGQY